MIQTVAFLQVITSYHQELINYFIRHTPMKHTIIFRIALLAGISVFTLSCLKSADEPVIGCEPSPPLMLPINVLDASTSDDLFFAVSPRYTVSDLFFFRKADVSRKDTIRPRVIETANIKVFLVPLKVQATGDTLIMKIKNQIDDTIVYSVKHFNGDCPYTTLDKVLFNGTELVSNEARYFIRK